MEYQAIAKVGHKEAGCANPPPQCVSILHYSSPACPTLYYVPFRLRSVLIKFGVLFLILVFARRPADMGAEDVQHGLA